MKKYQSYKPSGVEWIGEIPEHWEINRLKWITQIENSGIWGEDDEFPNSINVPIPTTGQLSIEGEWYYDKMNVRHLSKEDWNKYKCIEGDIVVVKSSGSSTNIITGKCGFISKKDSEKFGFSNFLLRVRPLKIKPKLVYYFLSSNLTKQRIERMVSSTTYPNLKVDEYSNSELLIPPLSEQHQIVQFLDSKTELVDKLISTKERKISLLKEQRTSLINQVVTKGLNPNVKMKDSGVEWIGEIPENTKILPLKYLVNLQGRIGYKGFTKNDFVNEGEGCLVLGGKHIDKKNQLNLSDPEYLNWDKYYESPEIMVKKGDLIISQRGTLGKCLFIDEDYGEMTINPSLVLVNNIKENPKYLWYNLQCDYLISNIKLIGSTTTIPMLSQIEIGSFKMIIPLLSEQNEIVQYLDEKTKEIDDLVHLEQKKIDLLKEYRQSLISEVVTGKIKVTTDE